MSKMHSVWAEINLDNLKHNVYNIKKLLSNDNTIIGVVKANAYGHGSVTIAKKLNSLGIEDLAVANLDEAIELRENDINSNIIILGISNSYDISEIIKYSLEPVVSSFEFVKELDDELEKLHKKCNIHIGLDTGMGRIGFREDQEGIKEIKDILKLKNIEVKSFISHFSDADGENKDYVKFQLDRYHNIIENCVGNNLKNIKLNFANSAAIIDFKEAHFNYVRAGIILYGYYPSDFVGKEKLHLKQVLTWKCRIKHIKKVEKGEYIGYGRNYKTKKETVVATIPIGYADGYLRSMSNKAYVIIGGERAPIIGNVCMDQCMVDITHIKGVKVSDEVILLGRDGDVKFDADDFSKVTNSINYESLCLIGRRTMRVYIENGDIKNSVNFI